MQRDYTSICGTHLSLYIPSTKVHAHLVKSLPLSQGGAKMFILFKSLEYLFEIVFALIAIGLAVVGGYGLLAILSNCGG